MLNMAASQRSDGFPVSFESPDSKMIRSASYDELSETLTITFNRPGANVYTYASIPSTLWQEFEIATSKGQFFTGRIRAFYVGRQVKE